MISHMMLTNNHISAQRLGEKNNQSRADLGLTNSQINGVVSIRKNSYDESASFADTDAITETTESSQFVPKSRWRQSVAYDAKHMEGGGGGLVLLGKWQIGPCLGVPGLELTKSLAASGRRSLAASPRAKITLTGRPPRQKV